MITLEEQIEYMHRQITVEAYLGHLRGGYFAAILATLEAVRDEQKAKEKPDTVT